MAPSARRLARERDRDLPELVEAVACALRGGSSLTSALRTATVELDTLCARELQSSLARCEHGVSLIDALEAWAGPSSARRMTAAAVAVGHHAGGAAAHTFDALAGSLRQRAGARREVEVMAAQARAQAWVIGLAPGAFAFIMALIDPRTIQAITSSRPALASVVAGVVLQGAGFGWMRRLVGTP